MVSQPSYRPFGAFRFILALMVLLQHGLLLLAADGGRDLLLSLELGAVAVAVFFAVSGFIVAEALATFYAGRPAAFMANRLLRVVPAYAAVLALSVAADCWLYSSGRLVSLDAPLRGTPWQPRILLAGLLEIVPGLSAQRISGQAFSFIPYAWTLRVEFAFYLVAAFAALAATRGGRRSRIMLSRLLPTVGYAAFAAFLVVHGAPGARQLLNIPFFAFGICLFLIGRARRARLHLALAAGCVPVAFILCGERGHPVLAWQLPLLCALFACLAALSRSPAPPGAWRHWDKRLGDLSYPLYIGHGLVLGLFCGLSPARGAVPYLAAICTALALAAALHQMVEAPLHHLRTRLRGAPV